MDNNPLISIIVPVYNVEPYLKQCIESLRSQSYKSIEIILINDGSTDNSASICDIYSKLDSRIIVVHQKNQGLSAARNKGLDIAKGDYISFIDSDDIVHQDFIKLLWQNIKDVDIAICEISTFNKAEPAINAPLDIIREKYSGRQMNEFLFQEEMGLTTVIIPNKLFRKALWSNFRFPIGKLHEDCAVIHRILDNAKNVRLIRCKMYFYRKRVNSITSKRSFKSVKDEYEALSDQVSFFKEKGQMELVKNANRSRKALLLLDELNPDWDVWKNLSIIEIIYDDLRTKTKLHLLFKKLLDLFK